VTTNERIWVVAILVAFALLFILSQIYY